MRECVKQIDSGVRDPTKPLKCYSSEGTTNILHWTASDPP